MSLVPARCTQCGASLTLDPSQEAAVCPFCKTPFIVEKAINNYSTTNITNIETLKADTVNIIDSNSAESLCQAGETFIKLGDYNTAIKKFREMCEKFPNDARGWYGLFVAFTKNFRLPKTLEEYSYIPSDAFKLAVGSYENLIDIFEKYCAVLANKESESNNLKNAIDFLSRFGDLLQEECDKIIDREITPKEKLVASLKNEQKQAEMALSPRKAKKLQEEMLSIMHYKVGPVWAKRIYDLRYQAGYTEAEIYQKQKELKIDVLKSTNERLQKIIKNI